MIAGAESVLALIDDSTMLIPGHGQVATRADLVAYHAGLTGIRDRIRASISRDESEDAVVASKPVGAFARPGKGTDRWVRVVYREYRKVTTP
jgi:hypothetical protein